MEQNPKMCEWCGKFIVLQSSPGRRERQSNKPHESWTAFEIMRDEEDRILQAYDGTLIVAREHRCKARCSSCGDLLIVESGALFESRRDGEEKPGNGAGERRPHTCRGK